VENIDQINHIKKECLKLLTRREHSRKEIEQKLVNKGFDPELIVKIIAQLTEKDWQSDSRFAESYLNQRSRKGFGPVRIAYELQQKGINAADIAEQIQGNTDNWFLQLEQVCKKKYADPARLTHEERAKCYRFLLHRGFSSAMINTFFKQLTK
jgi:regulatory protein